jgi:hypothetical protein
MRCLSGFVLNERCEFRPTMWAAKEKSFPDIDATKIGLRGYRNNGMIAKDIP